MQYCCLCLLSPGCGIRVGTGIVANVVALPAPASAGSLVYAGASAPTARARMALSMSSSGEGQTIKWSPPKTIWPGPAVRL